MNLLVIDTSSNSACIGLYKYKGNKLIENFYSHSWDKSRSHSEVITDQFITALSKAQISSNDIDCICLGVGPGSFTGIRVALNFAKALAYSHNIKIYCMNSLLIDTYMKKDLAENLIIVNNAFRNMVFALSVQTHPFNITTECFTCRPEYIDEFIPKKILAQKPKVIGNAVAIYKNYFSENFVNSCDLILDSKNKKDPVAMAEYMLQDKSPVYKKWNMVLPQYLRGSEAEEKLKSNKNPTFLS